MTVWLHRLYTNHHQQVFTHLLCRVGDWHLAQDLTSATFLRAATASYRDDGKPLAWLQHIATNLMLDHYRSAYYQRNSLFGDIPDPLDPDSDPAVIFITAQDDQEQAQHQARRAAAVRAAAAALPTGRQRQVIELYLTGLDIEASAEALDTTPSAVKALRVRAMVGIRIQLGIGVAA